MDFTWCFFWQKAKKQKSHLTKQLCWLWKQHHQIMFSFGSQHSFWKRPLLLNKKIFLTLDWCLGKALYYKTINSQYLPLAHIKHGAAHLLECGEGGLVGFRGSSKHLQFLIARFSTWQPTHFRCRFWLDVMGHEWMNWDQFEEGSLLLCVESHQFRGFWHLIRMLPLLPS